jgi:hypothetical protein
MYECVQTIYIYTDVIVEASYNLPLNKVTTYIYIKKRKGGLVSSMSMKNPPHFGAPLHISQSVKRGGKRGEGGSRGSSRKRASNVLSKLSSEALQTKIESFFYLVCCPAQ